MKGRIAKGVGFLAVAVLISFLCYHCAVYYCGRFHGRVLDSRTCKAIPGASVAGVYRIEYGTVGGQVEETVDAAETTTDSEGAFVLPSKLTIALHLLTASYLKHPVIHILAPGYETVTFWHEAQSHIDQTNVWLTATTYRTIARPVVSVTNNVWEFTPSPIESMSNEVMSIAYPLCAVPESKFSNYLRVLNQERAKCGLDEWHSGRK
jgi:hypothetical protein